MEKPAIGIVCATETERDPFLARMSDVREHAHGMLVCLLYTSPSPRDRQKSRMPSSA